MSQKRSFSSLQDDESMETPSVMSPTEKKWCIQTIRSLKKHKRAIAFLDPVDPIQFNIPDYFDIIKHPMDLGTVERQLLADAYPSVDAFKSDIQLIFDNCYLYNNPGDPVCLDAKKLEEHYQKLCKKEPSMTAPLPTPPSFVTEPVKVSDNINTPAPPSTTTEPEPQPQSTTIKLALQKPSIPAPPLSPPHHTPHVNKESHPMPEDQFKRCQALVRELKKPKYKGYAWPFENPVDAAAWGATDYYDIIKQPMDMSTYEKKLYSHQYSHEEQLAEDIRLMFRNCYAYNPPDHLVTNLGKEFEAVFERQWAKLHHPSHPSKKKKSLSIKKPRLDEDYVQQEEEEEKGISVLPTQRTKEPVDTAVISNPTQETQQDTSNSSGGPTILRLKIKVSQPKEETKAPEPMPSSSPPPKPKLPGLALSKEPPTPTLPSHGPKLAIGTKPPSPIKEKKTDKSIVATTPVTTNATAVLPNHDKWLALAKKTPQSPPQSQKLPTSIPTTQFKLKKEQPPPPPPKPKETVADVKPFDIADIYSQIHNEKRLKEQQKREEQEKWERIEKRRLEQERIATEKRMHELREQSRKFKAKKEQDKRIRLQSLNAVSIDISQQKMRFNEFEKEHMSRDQDWHDVYVWQRDTNDYRHLPAPGFVKRAQIKLPELRKRLLSKCIRLENSKSHYQPIDMIDDGGSDMDVE